MATETLTIQVPEPLYRRLEQLAALSGQSLENLITQTLSASIPPLPEDLPSPTRDALMSLEALNDDDLWQIVRSGVPEAEYEQCAELRAKHRAGTLGPDEQATLERLTRGQPADAAQGIRGGTTVRENLCLACTRCNDFKGDRTEGVEPETGETVPRMPYVRQRDLSKRGRAHGRLIRERRCLACHAPGRA
jgi:hypothetical protein